MDTRTRQISSYVIMLALSAAAALIVYPIVNKPNVLLYHADILMKEGKTAEADSLIVQAVAEGARKPKPVMRAARILLDEGQGKKAFTLLDQTLVGMRSIPLGLAGRMAGLLDQYGHQNDALTLLMRTTPEQRERSERLHVADLLRRQNRYAEALDEYAVLLAESPSDSEAAFRRVETLSWMGDLETALPLARDLVRAQPGNRPARLLLARILNWSGQSAEAEVEYKRLLGENL